MGVMYDYFAASSDDLAATAINDGPARGPFRTVETKWLDPVVIMGKLEELLTGRPYDEIVADERCGEAVAFEGDGELLVLTVTDGLRDGLAAATELGGVVAAWSQAEELRGWDAAELGEILRELVDLAKEAAGKGERLYCRVCV